MKTGKRAMMIAAAAMVGAAALGSLAAMAQMPSQDRSDLGGFDEISVAAGISVVFTQGDAASVVIENENGNFDDITLKVSDETLEIGRPKRRGAGEREAYVVRITAPRLEEVEASSSARFEAAAIRADSFEITLSSAASAGIGALEAGKVEIEASSGAELVVAGTCDEVDVDISSGAALDGDGLICAQAEVDASSGASASVFASERAEVDASSGSSVRVDGAPGIREIDASSGADVDVSL